MRSTLGNAASAFGAAQAGAGATRYLDGVDGTNVHRYHWANFPALTAGTNLAITSDDSTVTLNLVEALPSDEFVTGDDLVAVQKSVAEPEDNTTPNIVRGFPLDLLKAWVLRGFISSTPSYATTAAADAAGIGNNIEVLIGANRDRYMKVNGVWRAYGRRLVTTTLYAPTSGFLDCQTPRNITLSSSGYVFDKIVLGVNYQNANAVSALISSEHALLGGQSNLPRQGGIVQDGVNNNNTLWAMRLTSATNFQVHCNSGAYEYLIRIWGGKYRYGYGT